MPVTYSDLQVQTPPTRVSRLEAPVAIQTLILLMFCLLQLCLLRADAVWMISLLTEISTRAYGIVVDSSVLSNVFRRFPRSYAVRFRAPP